MRRAFPVLLGALAFLGLTTAAEVIAQETTTTTTIATTSTTTPRVDPVSTTTSTTQKPTTTTTAKSTSSSTTVANGGRPIPPPAAGPTQTLVPDLLGTPVSIETTSTTLQGFAPRPRFTIPTPTATETAAPISSHKTSPSGATLILATVAWLASLGGLLVYAEDRRASRWRHLAR